MISWDDAVEVRRLACMLACFGTCIASLEWLAPSSKLARDGIVAPGSIDDGNRFERFWRPHGLRIILVLRLMFAAFYLGTAPYFDMGYSAFAAGMMNLPLRARDPIGVFAGMDGAENVMTTTLLALGMTFFFDSVLVLDAALGFVAAQSLLEYASAGLTKLADFTSWARGSHILRILASHHYGHPRLAAWAHEHPLEMGALSIAVIAVEIAVPLALVLPRPFGEAVLLVALFFHVGNAFVMGLNTFVWGFGATYPAILYTRELLMHALAWTH